MGSMGSTGALVQPSYSMSNMASTGALVQPSFQRFQPSFNSFASESASTGAYTAPILPLQTSYMGNIAEMGSAGNPYNKLNLGTGPLFLSIFLLSPSLSLSLSLSLSVFSLYSFLSVHLNYTKTLYTNPSLDRQAYRPHCCTFSLSLFSLSLSLSSLFFKSV
jgi:hypothetical protein